MKLDSINWKKIGIGAFVVGFVFGTSVGAKHLYDKHKEEKYIEKK